MSDALLIEAREGHEVWRLNRPARRHALNQVTLDALLMARDEAKARGTSAVVLTGGAGVFCAGSDLGELRSLGGEEGLSGELPRSPLHQFFAAFLPAPFTLITAIDGAAIGGGCELALLGDVRIASPRSIFLLPPSKLGIVYPVEGAARLCAALGASLLRAMLVTARGVDAERLLRAGVLWSVTEDPLAEASTLAAELAALPLAARLANAALTDLCASGSPAEAPQAEGRE